jgi:hypothetical protein
MHCAPPLLFDVALTLRSQYMGRVLPLTSLLYPT